MNPNLRFFWDQTWNYPLIVMLSTTLLLLLITSSFRNDTVPLFDRVILGWFHSIQKTYLTHFFNSITWMGSLWMLLPLYLLLTVLVTPHILHFEKVLGITLWGSVITTYFVKYELERKRPYLFGPINELPIDPSFPSAHTAQITAFSLGIWLALHGKEFLYKEWIGALLIFLILAVASSRMYLQVHFPTDVIAGALISLFWGSTAIWIIKSGALG